MKLLKLGGSVITGKRGRCEPNLQNIGKLAKMLGELWEEGIRDVILVHGAGSFGHALVIEKGLKGRIGAERDADVAEVQRECARLSGILVGKLRENGVAAERISPHEIIAAENGRIASIGKGRVFASLEAGRMPVLHGDMVPDSRLGHSVCSGDQIAAKLAEDAQFCVFGTDVDGILVGGKAVGKIDASNFEMVKKHLSGSGSPDVTGGMLGKVLEMRRAGGAYFVANANFPGRLKAILEGKKAKCTRLEF